MIFLLIILGEVYMEQIEKILEIKNLTKAYGNLVAVKNLDLVVEKNTIHGFLGPNGSGKTTTIRCILGLLKPNSGKISVFSENAGSNNKKVLQKIGYLPGEVVLYPYYTVKQLLDYFMIVYGIKDKTIRKDLVKRLDLDESRPVKALSKGNRQKAGIVLALMHDPEFIILDEPTSGLDPLLQAEFFKILSELKEKGKTIFFSSHILSEIDRVCDKVSFIRNGSIISTENISGLTSKIGRKIILKFNDKSTNHTIKHPNLQFVREEGLSHIFNLSGDVVKTIHDLTENPDIVDISIPEPNVEDYFLSFY